MFRPADPVAALRLAAALFALLLPGTGRSADLVGSAAVVSANTIAVGDTRVRLVGIDGPRPDHVCVRDESEWECGRSAIDFLRDVIGSRAVRCTVVAEATGPEAVARCLAGPDDLALKMVLAGFAFAARNEGDDYVELEGVARRQRRGLWAADFVLR